MKRVVPIAALALLSCSDPEVSQVIVRIEADPGVTSMTGSIEVQIDGGATRSALTAAETLTLDGNAFPRHVAIAPKQDDPSRFFRVIARARRAGIGDAAAETFAQAALIGTYVRGETRTVVLRLEDSCIDVSCGTIQHCADARCTEPPLVEPGPSDGGAADMTAPDLGGDMGTDRCATDADCDDGVGCTIDACTSGNCTFTAVDAMCPESPNVCLRAVCDTTIGCTDEYRDGPCDNGVFCDGPDSCVMGTCTAGGSSPCVGTTTCDETMDRCIGCEGPDDCTNGEECNSGACACPGTSELCSVAGDEDCDGLADCADSDCEGQTCASGRVCRGGTCVVDATEICDDGIDNDGDLDIDCRDADCKGSPCQLDGGTGVCAAGRCEPPCVPSGPENTTDTCTDGMDNDCDDSTDCGDSECMELCICGGLCLDDMSPGAPDMRR